jgi:hypothetical protein
VAPPDPGDHDFNISDFTQSGSLSELFSGSLVLEKFFLNDPNLNLHFCDYLPFE